MVIKFYKPTTPSMRNRSIISFSSLSKIKPERTLIVTKHCAKGRNNQGRITIRHRGGGHKKQYRIIDFKRNKNNILGTVFSIEYDPNRNVNISLIHYTDGEKRYILHPNLLNIGDSIISSKDANITPGNTLPLKKIPLGTLIHNLELFPGKGGQLIRAAGNSGKIIAKENNFVIVRLPSKEIRLFKNECFATIGSLSNSDIFNIKLGKAGRNRWLGFRPSVRGSAMNPIDHPHGGGEGRCPIGKARPVTPWGKPALGVKTRKKQKLNQHLILYSRK